MSDATIAFPENPTSWKTLIALAKPQDSSCVPGQIDVDEDLGCGHYDWCAYSFFESGIYIHKWSFDRTGDYCDSGMDVGVWRRAADGALWAMYSSADGSTMVFGAVQRAKISSVMEDNARQPNKTKKATPTHSGADPMIALNSVKFPANLLLLQ